MKVLETERLILRHQTVEDAAFILELLNDPSWIRNIGDRGIRTLEEASVFIQNGPMENYARLGFGFYLVELKDGGIPIGICGLAKRDFLEDVDLGYALLPPFFGQGYAYEAASAAAAYAKSTLGLKRLVAITSEDNHASAKLLAKLGMHEEGMIPYGDTEEEVRLFGMDL